MQDVKLQVRLDSDLHQQLVESAAKNKRSLNSEVLHRLQSTFATDQRVASNEDAQAFMRRFDRMALQIDAMHKWVKLLPADKLEFDVRADGTKVARSQQVIDTPEQQKLNERLERERPPYTGKRKR